jgi:precorrin-2 dehydrogenase / sirohydrochlorin ferrochelatase
MAAYFPVALDLRGRRCLVVGAGSVATRKIEALIDAEATVIVVAPERSRPVQALAQAGRLQLRERDFSSEDLDGVFLVIAATDRTDVNREVSNQARARGVLVNAADDPASCDFILPAIVRRGDIQIAISTGGRSPALARHLRQRLEALLPPEYERLVGVLAEVRARLREEGARVPAANWQAAIDDELFSLIRSGDLAAATDRVHTLLLRP